MNTEDITVTLTRDEFDALRRFVVKSMLAFEKDADTWRRLSSDPDIPLAANNAKVCTEEARMAFVLDEKLTDAYVKAVDPELAATI